MLSNRLTANDSIILLIIQGPKAGSAVGDFLSVIRPFWLTLGCQKFGVDKLSSTFRRYRDAKAFILDGLLPICSPCRDNLLICLYSNYLQYLGLAMALWASVNREALLTDGIVIPSHEDAAR